MDHAEAFIREFKDKPFFLNLWLHEAHTPHLPQERFLDKFKHLGEAERVYASIVAEGDEGVGRIMKLIKEVGVDENTLVVFSTDNGPEHSTDEKDHKGQGLGKFYSVGETGGLKGEKRSLFAGGIRVPFIVRWPGEVPAGRTDTTSVLTAVDLLPTFLDAAGVALPAGYRPDGQSVLSAFKGEPLSRTKPIFWEWRGGDAQPHTWPSIGIRDGKWKLLVNKDQGKSELYDLQSDWAEKRNVANEKPAVVQRLSAKLGAWKSSLPTQPSKNRLSKARKKVAQKTKR